METTVVYWGYIGIMEKKMETTIKGGYIDGELELSLVIEEPWFRVCCCHFFRV